MQKLAQGTVAVSDKKIAIILNAPTLIKHEPK